MTIQELLTFPLFSEELGIDLQSGKDHELFKWLLATLLFGGPVSRDIARKTYRTFQKYRLLDPLSITRAGWSYLVHPVMREGGYVRHDGVTASHIMETCGTLQQYYQGSLNTLHSMAESPRDLENRLTALRGMEPASANIFLRELRPIWDKANPEPLAVVNEMAKKFKLNLAQMDRKSPAFAKVESALIRLKQTRSKNPRRA
ncbi:MAG: hypothetical protein PHC98_05775 [Syntrophotalea acetylenica]|jgi:hypothetical protein|uniref:Uncharacterized protein n=1 Tax=Syntrophotalea acetylenica TaxID=29542 RepID=A0A1L3GFD6_SYNAC|nr:hypothetical protein [Syntrophotalea acetylenica]APG24674.1 hypothetical protein A7E75_06265 [Syntrophotalea acetylenica]APG42725.1 hypothetical protein A6070_00190 [Syntrophotalea acetylenica]MDD4457083.1 hypothetical protein [Syntrophotalea acetylenica]MDY0262164.1 hypothetical protein [Syntrophotalea acetylenica]